MQALSTFLYDNIFLLHPRGTWHFSAPSLRVLILVEFGTELGIPGILTSHTRTGDHYTSLITSLPNGKWIRANWITCITQPDLIPCHTKVCVCASNDLFFWKGRGKICFPPLHRPPKGIWVSSDPISPRVLYKSTELYNSYKSKESQRAWQA